MIKKQNGFWVDGNGNIWDCKYYSKRDALANKLIDCKNCINCFDCYNCDGCIQCFDCNGCRDCLDCSNCIVCVNCVRCIECQRCKSLKYAKNYVKQPRMHIKSNEKMDSKLTIYYGSTKYGKSVIVTHKLGKKTLDNREFQGSIANFEEFIEKYYYDDVRYQTFCMKEIDIAMKKFNIPEGERRKRNYEK